MQKPSYSWGLIVAMLFVFFPVGIWMLVKKMTTEKFNYVKNGKSLSVLGWVLIGLAVIYLIMGVTGELKTDDGSSVVGIIVMILIIFGGGGAFALYKANSYIKKGTKYNRYISVINSNNDMLIDNIAAAYPTTYEKAAEDLQAMIDDGYFMNAYIDLNQRKVVMPTKPVDNVAVNTNTAGTDTQPRTVKCSNCGATNTLIAGSVNECEYCGTAL